MSDQNERALVARLRDRDEHALAELASTYGQRIFQLAFRYTRNREDAEEVVQDVLLKVFRKIDAFRGDSALSSWIHRITFNTAMSRMRRLKAMRAAEMSDIEIGTAANDDAPAAFDPPDCSDLADASVLKSQLRERLALAVVGLPEIYRAPVILRDFNGLSTEEASTKLQIKDQTLKSRLHRGRMLLRARLADFADGLAMRSDSADVLRAFYSRSTHVLQSFYVRSTIVERSPADCRFESDPIAR
jgi:RNA polymerase sigma-70 factor, ECF subfamily